MPPTTQQQRDDWLLEFHAIAAEWGGKCLSLKYINQNSKLSFQCAYGHQWLATPQNVHHKGSWCPHCNGNAKLSIDDAHQAATALGGVCLSSEYVGLHEPLQWQCDSVLH